jgi:type IV pilus assembly protein PilA
MLARIRKAQEEREGGFTLIELLVVMIIIGILAAIAIPVFLNQRKKAQDSAAKADVSTLGKEVATYYVDNAAKPAISVPAGSGRYSLTDNAATPYGPVDLGKVSNNVVLGTQNFIDSTHWCIDVTNAQGDVQTFKYSAKGGLATTACAAGDVT